MTLSEQCQASAPSGSTIPDGEVIAAVMKHRAQKERKFTPMEDATFMLELWETCICANIHVNKGSPLHRLVKWTLEDLKKNP